MTQATSIDRSVLVLAPLGRDAALTRQLLEDASFQARICADVDELCAAMRAGAGCALVTEEALSASAVTSIRAVLAEQPAWSDFPLILFSAGGASGVNTAQLARTLGKVTIIDRPVHVQTMLSAVWTALRARGRQYEARQAIQQRDQFLAMLGHELRNPLGAILFASELLGRDLVDPALLRQRTVIEQQTRHLARLVDDLLDVSRVTSGKVVLRRETVELGGLIDRVANVVGVVARGRKQAFQVIRADVPVLIDGDLVRLEQIVTNIVGNAVKYTHDGGRIEIELSFLASAGGDEGVATLRVRDTGVGIEPAMLDKVFDLFAQAPGTIDRSQGGLGIGLTLARSLVALHGGTVRATSDGPGTGAEFIVRLPARSRPVTMPRAVTSPGSPRSLRIVIVDDNADLREMLQELLEGVGHSVDTEENGERALARILANRPDLAIIDIGLPGMDGYEVARKVRGAVGDRLFLVALSGYGQPDDRERSRRAGFDLHMVKPVTAAALFQAIGSAASDPGR